jgi:hypothetical protein
VAGDGDLGHGELPRVVHPCALLTSAGGYSVQAEDGLEALAAQTPSWCRNTCRWMIRVSRLGVTPHRARIAAEDCGSSGDYSRHRSCATRATAL